MHRIGNLILKPWMSAIAQALGAPQAEPVGGEYRWSDDRASGSEYIGERVRFAPTAALLPVRSPNATTTRQVIVAVAERAGVEIPRRRGLDFSFWWEAGRVGEMVIFRISLAEDYGQGQSSAFNWRVPWEALPEDVRQAITANEASWRRWLEE